MPGGLKGQLSAEPDPGPAETDEVGSHESAPNSGTTTGKNAVGNSEENTNQWNSSEGKNGYQTEDYVTPQSEIDEMRKRLDGFSEWFWDVYDEVASPVMSRSSAIVVKRICGNVRRFFPHLSNNEVLLAALAVASVGTGLMVFWLPWHVQLSLAYAIHHYAGIGPTIPTMIALTALFKMKSGKQTISRERSNGLLVLSILCFGAAYASSVILGDINMVLGFATFGCVMVLASGFEYFRGHSSYAVNYYAQYAAYTLAVLLVVAAMFNSGAIRAKLLCGGSTIERTGYNKCMEASVKRTHVELDQWIGGLTAEKENSWRIQLPSNRIEYSSIISYAPGMWDLRIISLIILSMIGTMLPALCRNVAADCQNEGQRRRSEKKRNPMSEDPYKLTMREIFQQIDSLDVTAYFLGTVPQAIVSTGMMLYMHAIGIASVGAVLATFMCFIKKGLERDGANADLMTDSLVNTSDGIPLIVGLSGSCSTRRSLSNTTLICLILSGMILGWHLSSMTGVDNAWVLGTIVGTIVGVLSVYQPLYAKWTSFAGVAYGLSMSGGWLPALVYMIVMYKGRFLISLSTQSANTSAVAKELPLVHPA